MTSTDSTSSASSSVKFHTLTTPITLKLDEDNFLIWQQQVLATLGSLNLQDFLTTTSDPDSLLPLYQQQDLMIVSWLLASMTTPLLIKMVGLRTSAQIWTRLCTHYATQTRAKVRKLKIQLRQQKKDRSVTTYLLDIKKIVDTLAAIGSPITSEDHIECILDGLPEDYHGFITSVTSRLDPYTVDDIEALLLAQEERYEKFRILDQQSLTTNTATTSRSPINPSGTSSRNNNKFRSFSKNSRGSARNSYRSSTSTNTSLQSRLQCQICDKLGHNAKDCWHRYDKESSSPVLANSSQLFFPDNNASSILGTPSTMMDPLWYPDSGATHHITNDSNLLTKKHPYTGNEVVKLGNGAGMNICHIGSTFFVVPQTHSRIYLRHLLHVPNIVKNLLSVSKFTKDNNVFFEFHADKCYVKTQDNKILLQGIVRDGLYVFPPLHKNVLYSANNTQCSSQYSIFSIWHSRLGHASQDVVKRILQINNIPCKPHKFFCESCVLAKSHQLPFSSSTTVYTAPLQLVFIDIWGPAPLTASCGARYYISFLDAYTRYTWLYLITHKSQALSIFKIFKIFSEKQTGYKLKCIQTDNDKEFLCFAPTLRDFGIFHRLTCAYTHEQNGSIERKHRHIVDVGLSLLATSSLPMQYWGEAFTTAVYIINLLPTVVLNNVSPYQLLFNKTPDYRFLKTFGCACYPMLRAYNSNKLTMRSSLCLFIGYNPHFKGYICMSPTGKRYISRHVIFNENVFPFKSTSNPFITSSNRDITFSSPHLPLTVITSSHESLPTTPLTLPPEDHGNSHEDAPHSSHMSAHDPSSVQRDLSPPSPINLHPMVTRSKAGISKPKIYNTSIDLNINEPSTVKDALSHPEWHQAMQLEYDALVKAGTWTLVSPPSDAKIVGCKWVFKNKFNADGTLQRRKARLVAKGFHQTYGLDYMETFSPVVKHTTVRIILTLAITYRWSVHQVDINNAFLHGTLQEHVYMSQPPGFISSNSHLVCKLMKAIYGLKQAPRSWFLKLSSTLVQHGFFSSKSDPSLFIQKSSTCTLFVLIYVDDILITGNDVSAIRTLINLLHLNFALKDLGPLHYFLGIEVSRLSDGSMHLCQSKYIRDILHKAKMLEANPQSTPMVSSLRLIKEGSSSVSDAPLYRSIVGALQYLTITRPEIAYSVNRVCQFMHDPREHHLKAVKRILRYLAGTTTHGLILRPARDFNIRGFSDSDWGTDLDDRKSTTGYCIYIGSNLVSWTSNKQKVVSKSSTEAEYRSVAAALTDIIWIKSLLTELRVSSSVPHLYTDNHGAVLLAANPVKHSSSKHFELDLHFVRDYVQQQRLQLTHLPSRFQVADILTKPLSSSSFCSFRDKLMVGIKSTITLRGDVT